MDLLTGGKVNVNPYATDYDDINALKQISDRHHLAILLVHHLRKTGDADPLNMISGTSGIAGGADTNFVLQKDKRTGNTAKLICTGRDIEGRELFLEFKRNKFLWELLEPIEMGQLIIPDEIFLLCNFIKSADSFTGTATELIEKLNLDCSPAILKKKIIKHMEHLHKNGIHYSENRTFERREFTLRYDGNDDMTAQLSPQNLPSLPSVLSSDSNLATVTPCLPLCGEIDGGVG